MLVLDKETPVQKVEDYLEACRQHHQRFLKDVNAGYVDKMQDWKKKKAKNAREKWEN